MNDFRLAIHSVRRPLVRPSITHKRLPFYLFLPFFLALFISACGGGGGTNPPANTNPSGLSSPTSVSATAGNGLVTVGWSPVANATSYNIYISTGSNVSKGNYSKKTSGTASPVIISGLQNGTSYWMMVTATNATGESSASQIVQFTPFTGSGSLVAVSDFSAVPSNNSVTVNWTAVANATDYLIQHGTDANLVSGVGNLTTGSTSYTFNNLLNGTTYYYRIRAQNSSTQSAFSSIVSATPNYMAGWNGMVEIAKLGRSIFIDLYSRNDDLNSNRDALCTWTHGQVVYASTYAKTTDWATKVIISSSGGESASSLSENGDGVVAWRRRTYIDPPTNNLWYDDIVVKHYQTGIWGSDITISGAESGNYASSPKIKLDKDGNGVVVWHGEDGNFYVKTYDKATNTWSSVAKINTVFNPYYDRVKIDVDGNGVFVLFWDEPTATSAGVINRVFLRKYSKVGGWGATETVNLDDPVLNQHNSLESVSVNVNGDIFVLWQHSTSSTDIHLMFRRYASSTATWSTPVSVDASNFAMDWGTVKSNSSTNAIIYWKKRVLEGATTTVESNNFAVYDESTGTIGPKEQMLMADYDIYTVDTVTDAANSFRMFYALSGPTHAYQRDYNFTTQTWGTPVIINNYFGNDDYIATSNTAGEMMLTTNAITYDIYTGQSWELIRAKFYLP